MAHSLGTCLNAGIVALPEVDLLLVACAIPLGAFADQAEKRRARRLRPAQAVIGMGDAGQLSVHSASAAVKAVPDVTFCHFVKQIARNAKDK